MNPVPNRGPVDPRGPAEADHLLFPLLNEYWEALRRGEAADPQQWLCGHPEGPDTLRDLRVIDALNVARLTLSEDSRFERANTEICWPDRREVATRSLLEPGTILGECRVERLLGCGGMGEVYLAEQQVLGRKVAVKLLPARLAGDSDATQRFHKSVQILARLNPHPHIAAALHASTHEGRLYLVMEYVPGVDLKTQVRQSGPLPVEQACSLIRQVAAGLAYAHQQGIVHRDVKPANLMLTADGTVKILDLGLARVTTPEVLDPQAAHTHAGTTLGTLDYMAPEQARDARRADARSDLYSLGCTFYYLLTGRPPFEGGSQLDKAMAHALEAPPAVQQVRPDVPQAVADIVHKLLAKQPEDRYASARALVEALDRATLLSAPADAPVWAANKRTAEPRPKRTWRLRLAGAFLLLAMAVGLLSFLWSPLRTALVPRLQFGNEAWRLPSDVPSTQPGEAEALRIVSLEIQLFRDGAGPLGTIGGTRADFVAGRLNDDVRVRARLGTPGFCYLIAFNPDAKEQLCHPADKSTPPLQSAVIDYPADATELFPLTDGIGVQAFVLLASRRPLPSYAAWQDRVGKTPWKSIPGQGVWRFDGAHYELLGRERSEPRKLIDRPQAFEDLCRFLKDRPGIDAIEVLAFPVKPKEEERPPAQPPQGN
jgi:serine/threonine protein kinase